MDQGYLHFVYIELYATLFYTEISVNGNKIGFKKVRMTLCYMV